MSSPDSNGKSTNKLTEIEISGCFKLWLDSAEERIIQVKYNSEEEILTEEKRDNIL